MNGWNSLSNTSLMFYVQFKYKKVKLLVWKYFWLVENTFYKVTTNFGVFFYKLWSAIFFDNGERSFSKSLGFPHRRSGNLITSETLIFLCRYNPGLQIRDMLGYIPATLLFTVSSILNEESKSHFLNIWIKHKYARYSIFKIKVMTRVFDLFEYNYIRDNLQEHGLKVL